MQAIRKMVQLISAKIASKRAQFFLMVLNANAVKAKMLIEYAIVLPKALICCIMIWLALVSVRYRTQIIASIKRHQYAIPALFFLVNVFEKNVWLRLARVYRFHLLLNNMP